MNWREFSKLWSKQPPSQSKYEYFLFLQFVESHFAMKGISRPIIVEIGVKNIAQAAYYTDFLNAEYIGIDIAAKNSEKIIKGNSLHISTRFELDRRLDGRMINLLFIDGDHRYGAVKGDYELYHPLVKNLIAFHDVNFQWEAQGQSSPIKEKTPSVGKLWHEFYLQNKSLITFQCPGSTLIIDKKGYTKRYYATSGIGIVILDRDTIEQRWIVSKKDFETKYGKNGELYPLEPFHYNFEKEMIK